MGRAMKKIQTGFTLIEIMISVVIVGILMAVALPAYSDYVTRGRLTEAFSTLGAAQPAAEQYWSNGRDYTNFGTSSGVTAPVPIFTLVLSDAITSICTFVTMGTGKMAGFAYTIDQN